MEESYGPDAPKPVSQWDRIRGEVAELCAVGSFVLDLAELLQLLGEADTNRTAILMTVARLATVLMSRGARTN
ncbi:hypothetical protein GCM10011588_72640 [Nocardia jinanensis]|uniref:Uncharacterized protein n=1 Tax=Nocardia jinanensis TaxID=382504 RepID=A0A917S1R6_9NOCA|nr:hypothetical protein [Nocardia jinanensis]GGL47252.1 hypothetical protein GCM10011588_72640 [Nocardia jinanensis]